MTSQLFRTRPRHVTSPSAAPRHVAATIVGGFYLCMGGVHVGLVAARPEVYRHFADGALFGFVRSGWRDVFMAHPSVWGLAVAAGELVIGVLLLGGGRWSNAGWAAAIGFHLALMLFGWGFWLWSVPALIFLVPAAARDWYRAAVPR